MALTIVVDGQKIVKPGSYGTPKVELTAGFLALSQGTVAILGESDKGAPGSIEGVQSFTSAQISDIAAKFGSGPIVESARALSQPGRGEIINGAGRILVYKTNQSTKSVSTVKNIDDANSGAGDDIFDISSKSYGFRESLISFTLSGGSIPDVKPSISSTSVTFPLTFGDGDTLVASVNGVSYTFTASTANGNLGPHADLSSLLTVLNTTASWSPSKPVIATAGISPDTFKLTVDDTQADLDGFESRLEYGILDMTGTGTIENDLGLTTASIIGIDLKVINGSSGPVRGSRGGRIFTISRNNVSEVIPENKNEDIFTIRYNGLGTSCLMTISDVAGVKKLTTVCAGAISDNLDITLSDYSITELVEILDLNSVYSAETTYFNASNIKVDISDYYSGIEIKILPLDIKKSYKEIQDIVNERSKLINISKKSNVYGQLLTNSTKILLTGGVRGITTNSMIQSAFDAMLTVRTNIIIPLFSRDASIDIVDALTDPNSTYTIASINSMTDAHCRLASNIKNRSERNGYVSLKDTFLSTRNASKTINSQFVSYVLQDTNRVDLNGNSTTFQPYILASCIAGIQAGSKIGTDLTFKYLNIDGIGHQDFNANDLGDIENAILDGLLVVEQPSSGGFRIVAGNTSYSKDENFVFNSIGTFEAGQSVAYDLRIYLENIFVGRNIVGGRYYKYTTAQQIVNATIDRMSFYLRESMIVGDDNNKGKGYDNITVSIEGGNAFLSACVTPAQGLRFILPTITLENIRQIA